MNQQPAYPQGNYPQTPPPAKSNKKLWIILGIVIGIPTILMGGCVACVVLLGLSGAGNMNLANSNSRPASSTSPTSSQPTAPSRPEIDWMPVYKTGETVNVGYMQYQVYGTWYTNRLSSNQFLNQPPDATYLFVDLGVVNTDKEERTVPPFKLIDENKAEYGTSDKA